MEELSNKVGDEPSEYEQTAIPEYLDFIRPYAKEIIPTGSRFICDPAPTDTDEDWLVLETAPYQTEDVLIRQQWRRSPSTHYYRLKNDFCSWKKTIDGTPVNLIVTHKPDFYWKFKEATFVAKEQNITNKQERVDLFEMFLYRKKKEPLYRYNETILTSNRVYEYTKSPSGPDLRIYIGYQWDDHPAGTGTILFDGDFIYEEIDDPLYNLNAPVKDNRNLSARHRGFAAQGDGEYTGPDIAIVPDIPWDGHL